MMLQWEPDMVRFMRDAAEYGDYFQRILREMLPYLKPGDRLCDAGCGLGYLGLAAAPHVARVSAVDRSERALQVLRETCRARQVTNLDIVCGDMEQLQARPPFDVMAFCFFGRTEEILRYGRRLCRGTIFAVKKNYAHHRFSVGRYPQGSDTFSNACAYLTQRRIPFAGKTFSLEFGQPLRSMEDARRFFELYQQGGDPIPDAFLRKRLVETGDAAFPLYLPHRRQLGCLVLNAADIPP